MFDLGAIFREEGPLSSMEGDRKMAPDGRPRKGTTMMYIEQDMMKGNPKSLIGEGYRSLGMKNHGGAHRSI
jgi:hypothetical protein